MNTEQIIFIIITVVALGLFISEKLRVDIIGLLIILALSLTGILEYKQAFSGFASEPALILSAVFVLSAGLSKTGVTDIFGEWIGKLSGKTETQANLVIMTGAAFLSAFTHHVMVTAMILPLVMKLCKEKGFHASRMLIPMATAASLGTILTLIGAPAVMLANGIIGRSGQEKLGFFTIAKVGLPIVVVSFFFILIAKFLLPRRSGEKESDKERFKLGEITTEVTVPESSKWIGKKISDLKVETEKRFQILAWYRKNDVIWISDENEALQVGDGLVVKMGSDELVSMEEGLGLTLTAVKRYGSKIKSSNATSLEGEHKRILKALIAPKSEFVGKTVSQLFFYHNFGVVTLGIWRKDGWIHQRLASVELQEGDMIVLWGPENKLLELSEHKGFLMFVPFYGEEKRRKKALLAVGVMASAILASVLGWTEPYVAFVPGAVAMVLTKCVSAEEAYSSIETKIFVMIAGVIPLGIAMEKVGLDKYLAEHIFSYTQGWDVVHILLIFFIFSALLTQILSDAATVVLLAPIAVAFAQKAHISVTASVVTVTIAAVASFLTPIGHHGNLLILSPGGYKFSDFLKIGLPLTVIIAVMTCYLSLRVWP